MSYFEEGFQSSMFMHMMLLYVYSVSACMRVCACVSVWVWMWVGGCAHMRACSVAISAHVQFSHIVAIKTSGNVFSYEAVQQFNVKLKSWHDLITDVAFTKDDIIHIQVFPMPIFTFDSLSYTPT